MKLADIIVIGIGALALLSVPLAPFVTRATRGESGAVGESGIPLIDIERPAMTETATFALG
ncbi:MAG: hypothetical protein ABID71_05475 [Chloroflexota bacterium]